jgi:hypothetical protein
MGLLDRFRRFVWRTEERSNKLEYAALDQLHHAEDAIDERTGGRFYDAVEELDEGSERLLERLHLDEEEAEEPAADPDGQAPEPKT